MQKLLHLVLSVIVLAGGIYAQQPIETGVVEWKRDHDAALEQSQKEGKPVFVLFQEVPGCAGCKTFGKEVLSDPKLASVIEKSFIPLLIYNNRGGNDAELLKKYGEPAWNFQVVRFLDAGGQDLIPRKDRVWDKRLLSQRMVKVLQKTKQPVPAELASWAGVQVSAGATDVTEKLQLPILKQAAISQYCFWTGERVIGAIDGVIETEAGFLNGREVTKVTYDPDVVSVEKIHRIAAAHETGDQIYTDLNGYRKAPASDQKRQLRGTRYARIKMTNEQATKVNAWVRTEPKKALEYLQPEQRKEL